jgi:hypothetical protein
LGGLDPNVGYAPGNAKSMPSAELVARLGCHAWSVQLSLLNSDAARDTVDMPPPIPRSARTMQKWQRLSRGCRLNWSRACRKEVQTEA